MRAAVIVCAHRGCTMSATQMINLKATGFSRSCCAVTRAILTAMSTAYLQICKIISTSTTTAMQAINSHCVRSVLVMRGGCSGSQSR
jgi:hypothetical protein